MARLLAYFLTLLLLLQMLGPELLVVNYQLHKAQITRQHCVNKARPWLRCDGKCYLARQLRKAENPSKKAPVGLAKIKYEVLPTPALVLPAPRRKWPVAQQFASIQPLRCPGAPAKGPFRPPCPCA